jgi:DNA-binding transcriptional regulator YiaG
LAEGYAEDSIQVGNRVFTALLPAKQCPECEEAYFSAAVIGRFELMVAAELARSGEKSAEAFVFMRKAIALRAVDLATLLDVTPETISRWEHGKVPIEHRAIAVLGGLVIDDLRGTSDTAERLRALRQQHSLPNVVNLGKLQIAA